MTWRALMVCAWLSLAVASAAEPRQLVLVASASSPAQTLTGVETRMLYLGYSVRRGRQFLRPVRNVSDPLINAVFLQHVVAMSQSAFDQRTLVAALQKGRPPPPEINNTDAVLRRLRADPLAISYLWLKDAQMHPDIRILRVLWVD